MLGTGTSGQVYSAKWAMGPMVAVKLWNKTESKEDFETELKFLQRCAHEHIVRFYGYVYQEDAASTDPIMALVMELCLGTVSQMKQGNRGLVNDLVNPGGIARGVHKRSVAQARGAHKPCVSFSTRMNW